MLYGASDGSGGCCADWFVAAVVLESFAKGDAPGSASMPACIVLERWDYSLSDWNNKLQRQPDDIELQSALYMVSNNLCLCLRLHAL